MTSSSCGGAGREPFTLDRSIDHGGGDHAHQPLPRPHLVTLDRTPSWVNRAGRVDRSACVELRASDIWRNVPHQQWKLRPVARPLPGPGRNPRSSSDQARDKARQLECRQSTCRQSNHRPSQHPGPCSGPARSRRSTREAHADFVIRAAHLARLHNTRLPQQLAGDQRTAKSNAMRGNPPHGLAHFASNPNRGATRSKKLCLWSGGEPFYALNDATACGWSQTVRIERWRLHDRLAQHFLICPRCGKKQLKLFLTLGWEQELADAQVAEAWIAMFDTLHASPLAPGAFKGDRTLLEFRAKLIDRYGLLFRDCGGGGGGRQLVCRKCLGVRYGEVKWHRLPSPEAQAHARNQRRQRHAEELARDFAQRHEADMREIAATLGAMRQHATRQVGDDA